ncbi:MAG: hypothetical protein J0M20_01015, partial [Burkholderiales bacterium]|nr:hypothetical protein [Burkholderiales bacterium]
MRRMILDGDGLAGIARAWPGRWVGIGALALLTACGGGESVTADTSSEAVQPAGSTAAAATAGAVTTASATGLERAQAANAPATTRSDAFRLLTQASFGPTEADI